MLDLAREKAARRSVEGVRFEWADALQLPYDGERFDAVTVGFGVRNLADLDRGLREMARVLKPGGRAVILEITQPDAGRRSRSSTRSGSTGSCRCSAPSPATRRPTRTCPSRCAASPARASWPRRWTRRLQGDPLHGAGRRDHRDPQRRPRVTRPSSVPPPVTAVLDASSRWLPARLGEVEQLLREAIAGHGEVARRGRRGDPRGRRQAAAADAGPALRWARGRRRRGPRRRRDRAGAHGDARPRRRPRRRAVAAGASDGRRHLRPRARRRHRGPALLARLRPPRRGRGRARGRPPRRRLGRPRPGGARPAPGRLRPGSRRGALPRPLPAEDGAPLRVRLPARPRRGAAAASSGRGSASPSSCSTTSSTSAARRSGPARPAAPTCSTAR